jgi:hypothetical protein
MTTPQLVAILANVAIYVALIAFVLYRQMTRQQLRARRLVLLPVILVIFGVQQLAGQHLSISLGSVTYLVINGLVGLALGVWRGTTFRLWTEEAVVMVRGTFLTLLSWGALIAVRVIFAIATHATKYGQGVVIGELLVALAITFAAQNAVIWLRALKLAPVPVLGSESSLTRRVL